VRDVGAEELLDALDAGERVFHHVVQQAGGDRDRVEPHVGEDVGDLERVDEVGLARVTHLTPMLHREKT